MKEPSICLSYAVCCQIFNLLYAGHCRAHLPCKWLGRCLCTDGLQPLCSTRWVPFSGATRRHFIFSKRHLNLLPRQPWSSPIFICIAPTTRTRFCQSAIDSFCVTRCNGKDQTTTRTRFCLTLPVSLDAMGRTRHHLWEENEVSE
jgi:hypothetical protein